jgi:hypothetical protein
MPKTTLPKNMMSGLLDFIIRRGALTKGRWDLLKKVKYGLKVVRYSGQSLAEVYLICRAPIERSETDDGNVTLLKHKYGTKNLSHYNN